MVPYHKTGTNFSAELSKNNFLPLICLPTGKLVLIFHRLHIPQLLHIGRHSLVVFKASSSALQPEIL